MQSNTYADSGITDKSTNTLMLAYQNSINKGEITFDPKQEATMQALQVVYDDILATHIVNSINASEEKSTLDRLLSFGSSKEIPEKLVTGLYIWGGVGSGKTHMVDFFFKQLPIEKKMRLHFHRFMQIVHDDLKHQSSIENPLKAVAKKLSTKAQVLCLDEMHVNDITDAMILSKLFTHLFEFGVTLITTSNVPPSGL